MSTSRTERIRAERAALGAWLDSRKPCIQELTIVPPCRDCGRIPAIYARFDDGSVRCLDRRDCETHADLCNANLPEETRS